MRILHDYIINNVIHYLEISEKCQLQRVYKHFKLQIDYQEEFLDKLELDYTNKLVMLKQYIKKYNEVLRMNIIYKNLNKYMINKPIKVTMKYNNNFILNMFLLNKSLFLYMKNVKIYPFNENNKIKCFNEIKDLINKKRGLIKYHLNEKKNKYLDIIEYFPSIINKYLDINIYYSNSESNSKSESESESDFESESDSNDY